MMNDVSFIGEDQQADHVKIMAITWNMQGGCPKNDILDLLFQKDNIQHDIYVLATQEAVRPIAQSMLMPSKDKLNQRLMEYFNQGDSKDFTLINSIALAATHMVIICKKRLIPYISNIHNETLSIGMGDMLSNKGSVCISFMLGKLRLLFINCHLEAHDGGLVRRNEQWLNIN